jgi:zinc D-Ala-D-Ala carboxypeptidase
MTYAQPARAAHRTRSAFLAAGIVVSAALIGVAASSIDILHGDLAPTAIGKQSDQPTTSATVFDDENPGVANLDPSLLDALTRAATDAADDGVEFVINSGWRSREYQKQLLKEAVSKYGSEQEAARWVATPGTSPHVSGDAVDIGPSEAKAWLSENGAQYGLCQIYSNEPWHFELRPDAIDHGCPAKYADPTQDPRMHR